MSNLCPIGTGLGAQTAKAKLLIVEDEEPIRNQLSWALKERYDILLAEDRMSAMKQMASESPCLIILDLGLPPGPREATEGFITLDEILKENPQAKVIIITGNQDKASALKAIEQGAFDFFTKPPDMQQVKVVLERAAQLYNLERENITLREQMTQRKFEELIGESSCMQKVFSDVTKVATTDAAVLILGESGTGKELVAKSIHQCSNRAQARFVIINCGAIPETLLESELFGHEKGAFTGADARKTGKIELANHGTLFLDEIGELTPSLQVKLLRFLQGHCIERLGGNDTIPVDVRVIAATNQDLEKAIRERIFREDLYYRLGVVTIALPPLREREEDVLLLAKAFLGEYSSQYRKPLRGFRADATVAIQAYAWPGNVRELENRVKRAVIMTEGKNITPSDLELDLEDISRCSPPLREIRGQVEREHIKKVLSQCSWNISRASKQLGITRPTLHDLIKKYKLNQ